MQASVAGLVVLILSNGAVLAETCQDYPNTDGINVEAVSNGIKIISTGSAEVLMDDVASMRDGRTEAILQAKADISRFLSEGIQSAESVDRAVQETKSMQGASKDALRKEVVIRLMHLSSSSSALLRGVVSLGECYTPGKEYRVSVGIKPETLRAAGDVADQIVTGGPGASSSATTQPLNGTEGFSHTDGLKKF